MGLSVQNQVDQTKYFSLSTIDKNQMVAHGLTISIERLKQIARTRTPHAEIVTGRTDKFGQQRLTKIWRYDDFKQAQ